MHSDGNMERVYTGTGGVQHHSSVIVVRVSVGSYIILLLLLFSSSWCATVFVVEKSNHFDMRTLCGALMAAGEGYCRGLIGISVVVR